MNDAGVKLEKSSNSVGYERPSEGLTQTKNADNLRLLQPLNYMELGWLKVGFGDKQKGLAM